MPRPPSATSKPASWANYGYPNQDISATWWTIRSLCRTRRLQLQRPYSPGWIFPARVNGWTNTSCQHWNASAPARSTSLAAAWMAPSTRLKAPARRQGWFFPFYNARCIPALTLGYRITGQERYLETAAAALDFILRVQLEDGSFPQALRANGRTHRYPRWVAGVGDILRAMSCLEEYQGRATRNPALNWMLQGCLPGGGVRTADGFARRSRWPDWRACPIFAICWR